MAKKDAKPAEQTGCQVEIKAGAPEAANLPAVPDDGETLPAVPDSGAWGSEGVDSRDILMPKILLMQGLSKLVTSEKAKMGDFVDSLSHTILGGKEKPLDFIPFHTFKTWIIFHEVNGKLEYVRQEPMTPLNQDWPLEEVMEGTKVRRDKAINIYCVLPEQVATGEFFPYLISFRRTSYTAGRKLTTAFAKLKMFKIAPAKRVFSLSCTKQENEKGVFYVADVVEKRKSTEPEVKAAWDWHLVMQSANVKIDNSDLETEAAAGESAAAPAAGGPVY